MSYRDSNGVAEQVLHGTDPTRFVIEHLNFEIIHITFTKGSDALAEDVRYRLTFYFRASPRISLSGTIAATRRMGALVKISNVTVLVRPDAWFLEYDDFPVFPAFVKALSAPNAAEYELAPFASCALEAGYGLKCSGRNFAP